MPRPARFTRADIAARAAIVGTVGPPTRQAMPLALRAFDNLAKRAFIDRDNALACLARINEAFQHYSLELLVSRQEHPARIIAALGPLEAPTRDLLSQLWSLPASLRQS